MESKLFIQSLRNGETPCLRIWISFCLILLKSPQFLFCLTCCMFMSLYDYTACLCFEIYRSMFNVLIILVHRPFASDSRLNLTSSSIALEAFLKCSLAAFEVDRILRIYERSYFLTQTHHMVSYATYVRATIHVRLAAQR